MIPCHRDTVRSNLLNNVCLPFSVIWTRQAIKPFVMSTYLDIHNWGDGIIAIKGPAVEYRPTELHFKANGARDGTPSLCIVLVHPSVKLKAYGQFTLRELNEALGELGYKIEPVKTTP